MRFKTIPKQQKKIPIDKKTTILFSNVFSRYLENNEMA